MGQAATSPIPAGSPSCHAGAPSANGMPPCGLWSPTPCQREGGSTTNRALPITLSSGTTPRMSPPPNDNSTNHYAALALTASTSCNIMK